MRLFFGKEAEGMFQGFQTLFVAGDVPYDLICQYADKHCCIQVYFGADNRTYINWETVKKFLNSDHKRYITVETIEPVPLELTKVMNLFVVIPVQNNPKLQKILQSVLLMKHKTQLKFDTEDKSYLASFENFISNNRDDINSDKEVWRRDETALAG